MANEQLRAATELAMASWSYIQKKNQKSLGLPYFKSIFARSSDIAQIFADRFDMSRDDCTQALERHADMIFKHLEQALLAIDAPHLMQSRMEILGRQHTFRGVLPEHVDVFGAALLDLLAEEMGPMWSDELREAWLLCYACMADPLKRGIRFALANKVAGDARTRTSASSISPAPSSSSLAQQHPVAATASDAQQQQSTLAENKSSAAAAAATRCPYASAASKPGDSSTSSSYSSRSMTEAAPSSCPASHMSKSVSTSALPAAYAALETATSNVSAKDFYAAASRLRRISEQEGPSSASSSTNAPTASRSARPSRGSPTGTSAEDILRRMREARKSSFRSLSSSSLSRSNTSLNDVGDALDRTLVVAAAESPRRSLKNRPKVSLSELDDIENESPFEEARKALLAGREAAAANAAAVRARSEPLQFGREASFESVGTVDDSLATPRKPVRPTSSTPKVSSGRTSPRLPPSSLAATRTASMETGSSLAASLLMQSSSAGSDTANANANASDAHADDKESDNEVLRLLLQRASLSSLDGDGEETRLRLELAETHARVIALERTLRQTQLDRAHIREDCERCYAENEELTLKLRQMGSVLEHRSREVHELQMELASLNEYVKTTDAPYAARENREGNCGNCRDLNEKLEQSLTELEHMRDFYDELSEILEKEHRSAETDRAGLHKTIEDLHRDYRELEAMFEDERRIKKQQQEAYAVLQSEVERLRDVADEMSELRGRSASTSSLSRRSPCPSDFMHLQVHGNLQLEMDAAAMAAAQMMAAAAEAAEAAEAAATQLSDERNNSTSSGCGSSTGSTAGGGGGGGDLTLCVPVETANAGTQTDAVVALLPALSPQEIDSNGGFAAAAATPNKLLQALQRLRRTAMSQQQQQQQQQQPNPLLSASELLAHQKKEVASMSPYAAAWLLPLLVWATDPPAGPRLLSAFLQQPLRPVFLLLDSLTHHLA